MPFSVNFVFCVAGSATGEHSDCCPPQAEAPVDIFLPGKEAIGWALIEELKALSVQSGDTPELREAFSKTERGQLVDKVFLGFASYPAGVYTSHQALRYCGCSRFICEISSSI